MTDLFCHVTVWLPQCSSPKGTGVSWSRMRTDVPLHTLLERPATSWTAPRCPDMHVFHAGPFSCYLLLQVWGKVHPVLERLQTKPLPGLVVGGQAKVAPALQPAGHEVLSLIHI